ncbi:SBBP repeat-containing protein [Pontibacter pudoricolor]|uniref:SBBP repeat-containing protein n=1 Tax=Pontibacter pudoricolor TaxID=2694930 RepID=UPI0013913D1C|nr:SBBP repeat-containing protein [Pontibacter pudoricolor]
MFCLFSLAATAQQVTEEWAKRYDRQDSLFETAVDIAVDAAGNSYVIGTSIGSGYGRRNIVTIKYSPTGEELWVKAYEDDSLNQTEAIAIAVDNTGGVYVIGYTYKEASYVKYDYITIRYEASTGNQVWARISDTGGNDDDIIMPSADIAIDNTGSVYVSFSVMKKYGEDYDYATVRFEAATGREIWASYYDSNKGFDSPNAIAVDNAGGIYVTGNSWSEDEGNFISTTRYDAASGEEAWTTQIDKSLQFTTGKSIAVDNKGNVYVTGNSGGRLVLVRYDTKTGEAKWVSFYEGALPNAIAVDDQGGIYITGYGYAGGSNESYVTIQYDVNSGERKWVSYYEKSNGYGKAEDIAVDNTGGVYVTGFTKGDSNYFSDNDYTTIRYDAATGEEIWVKQYDNGNRSDIPVAIVVGKAGGIYVTGTSNQGYATIRYNATTGEQAWVTRHSTIGSQNDEAIAVTIDNEGNSYITGTSSEEIVTVKYSPEGEELWAKVYDKGFISTARAIAVDNKGGVYVTGYTYDWTSVEDSNFITIRYDAETGDEIWANRYNGLVGSYEIDEAKAIAIDSDGGVYIIGNSISGDHSNSEFATIRYNAISGEQVWIKRYSNAVGADIVADNTGGVFVTGYSYVGSGTEYVTVRYNASDGTESWASRYNGANSYNDNKAVAISIDNKGSVFVTGSSGNANSEDDYATIRYEAISGKEVWVSRYKGEDNSSYNATGIAVDDQGVYVTGNSFEWFSDYDSDYVTVRYNSANGEQDWVQRFEGESNAYVKAIAIDNQSGVYVTGYSYVENYSSRVFNTLKYNSTDGKLLWHLYTDGPEDEARDLALDPDGNVIVTGYSYDFKTGTGADFLTIKYSQKQCPALADAAIQGKTTAAVKTKGFVYSLLDSNATYFTWLITGSDGSDYTSFTGQGTNIIKVNWPSKPDMYKLSVTYGGESGCPSTDTTKYVHIYDPAAGFVTGGGWITSPVNSVYEFMQQGTKAYFGLMSKYKKGEENQLQGETQLLLENGSFYFRSISQQSRTLVISGNQAFYRGTGKVSHRDDKGKLVTDPRKFMFLVAATDWQLDKAKEDDRLRILVWEIQKDGTRGAVVYDNQTGCSTNLDENMEACQTIGGGNIVIHRYGGKNVSSQSALMVEPTPDQTELLAYPTAFSERTTLAFTSSEDAEYTLELYDLKGAMVRRIAAGSAQSGQRYEHELQADGLSKDMYLVRLTSGSTRRTVKLEVQK